MKDSKYTNEHLNITRLVVNGDDISECKRHPQNSIQAQYILLKVI